MTSSELSTERRLRVLVVDDNRDAADTLATMLQIMGHHAEVAYDGTGALEIASRLTPNLVVLDIGLPGIDGYEVARRLRSLLTDVLLVALTGYGSAADRQRSREAGFHEHLVKPLAIDDLRRILARSLPQAREGLEPPAI